MSFGSMPMMGGSPMMMSSTPMMGSMPMTTNPMGSPMISGPNYNVPPLNPGMAPNMMPNQSIPFGPPPQSYESQTPTDQATIIVTLPVDARLYVDGTLMTLTGAVRTFRAPNLQPNLKYTYTIRMEVERNGKKLEDSKTVELQPGKTTQVVFAEPAPASGTARLDIKVPAGATLTVEGQAYAAGQQSIQTPALESGKDYVYTLKLENDRNGRKETLTRDVNFRAGEVVAVSFEALAKR
jgi:uncharacterized protein (TIGR03000 family)